MDNNYFDKLYPHVMGYMVAYIDDFLVCDRKLLAGYSGQFILGYRDSGSNLLLNTPEYLQSVSKPLMFGGDQPGTVEQLIANVDAILFSNTKFIYGENGDIKVVDKQKAVQIFKSWLPFATSCINKEAA